MPIQIKRWVARRLALEINDHNIHATVDVIQLLFYLIIFCLFLYLWPHYIMPVPANARANHISGAGNDTKGVLLGVVTRWLQIATAEGRIGAERRFNQINLTLPIGLGLFDYFVVYDWLSEEKSVYKNSYWIFKPVFATIANLNFAPRSGPG